MKTRLIAIFSLLFILLLVSCDESEEIEPVAGGETAPEKMMYILTEFTYENRTREVDYDSSKVVPLRLANSGLGYMTLVEPQTRAFASTGDLPMPFTDETAEIRNELGEYLRLSNGDYIVIYKHILIDTSAMEEEGTIYIGLDDYVYMLARLDKDGQVLWEKPIRDIHESLWDNYYVFMDNDENLYFRMKASDNNDWQIAVVSTDGELLFALEAPEGAAPYGRYIIQTSDGQVYSACADRKENKIRFFPVDTENRCFGEENKKLSIPYDAKQLDDKSTGTSVYIQNYPFSSCDGAYLMYYYDNTTVYGVDETGTAAPVFRWLDVGLSSDVVRDIYAENDYFFIEVNEEANGGYRVYSAMISPVPISSVFGEGVTEIPTLKLAVDTEANGNYSGIISYAAKFIRSGGCRVEVVSYSDTEGGLTANQKLAHDISKGNAPDMVIFGGGLSYEILSDSGIFTDLYPLMDKSGDYTRDKLLPCVLKPFENGKGELCRLVTEYDLMTLTANKKYVGDKPGWSFDDYTKTDGKLTGDQYMFGVMDKSNAGYSMLEMILPLEIGEFIDYDAGKCDLDGLRKLLELCNNTKKGTFGYRDATVTSSETMILRCSDYYRLDEFLADRYIYFPEGEGVQIGYPTPDGKKSGTAVRPLTSLAITKQCQSKDVAWKLVEHIIRMKDEKIEGAVSEPSKFREGMVSDALFRVRHFTCSRSGMETWVAYGKEREYAFTSAAWGLDIDSKDLRSDQRTLPVGSLRARMTDADAKAFMSLFEKTDMVYIYEPSACGIILEDASMYFAGEKTLDEVMKLITDRINTMIEE